MAEICIIPWKRANKSHECLLRHDTRLDLLGLNLSYSNTEPLYSNTIRRYHDNGRLQVCVKAVEEICVHKTSNDYALKLQKNIWMTEHLVTLFALASYFGKEENFISI